VTLGVVTGERAEIGEVRFLVAFLAWAGSTGDVLDKLDPATFVIEQTHGQRTGAGTLGGAGGTDEGVGLLSLEAAGEHEA